MLTILFHVFPQPSQTRWLGVASPGIPEQLGCAGLPLRPQQRELCHRKHFLLPSIQEGARLAIVECQSQFRHERWNCSTRGKRSVFGHEQSSGESLCSQCTSHTMAMSQFGVCMLSCSPVKCNCCVAYTLCYNVTFCSCGHFSSNYSVTTFLFLKIVNECID